MALYLGQDDAGTSSFSLQDFEPSWSTKMNAAVRESWLESYGPAGLDYMNSVTGAGNEAKLSAADAASAIKESGVKFGKAVSDGQYTSTQLNGLLERQRELTSIKDVRERTPWDLSSPIRGIGMFGAGIADPVNLATAFVPWTKTISALNGVRAALVGSTLAGRSGARAILGGADAAISTIALEAPYSYVRNQIGDDYGALDSMANIAFGAAFGTALHVGGGAGLEGFRGLTGRTQEYERFRGLGNEEIQSVQALAKEIKDGMDPRDAARAAETFTPRMRAAAGIPDADMSSTLGLNSGAGSRALENMVSGGDTRIRIGETYEPAKWSVIESDQLTATVDKADNQFRDRSRAAYQTEIQQRANNLDFNLLADSPVMDYGAPTLATDGRIIGGNGRALFIGRAYDIGKGAEYRTALEARMVEMGIDPDLVRGMKKPVLVRVLQREVDVKRAAMLSNEGGATDMSPLEQAKVDAERLSDAQLVVGADGNLDAPENRGAIRKWLESQPENKRNSLVDNDGRLSASGLQRLNSALLFKAYGDSPVLGRLIESMDPGSRNVAMALGRTAPVVSNARSAIASGDLHPLDIAADIQQAVEKYNSLRDSGMKVSDYVAQMDAFGDDLTPESMMLLEFIGRNISSPRRMADGITGFYDRLSEAGNPKQADIFGGESAPDKLGVLDASIRSAEEGLDTAAEVVAGLSPETREVAIRSAVAQSVDGRMVDVDTLVGMDESVGTATRADAAAAMARNFEPEQVALADFEASADVQARVATAPKWAAVSDAEAAMADADALLADTVASGDQAFKYSRGEAPGQKKATLWQGTTTRFGAEEGAPLGRFRWDMINSAAGEGAQAFGFGHYLAQQAWISQSRYRERLLERRKNEDGYTIPDGAGGVLKLSARNDEPSWSMPDGVIVNSSQKSPRLKSLADAVTQIDGYGYARSKSTFESLVRQANNEAEHEGKRLKEYRLQALVDGIDDPASDQAGIAMYERRIDIQKVEAARYRAAIVALDEVTVEVEPTIATINFRGDDSFQVNGQGNGFSTREEALAYAATVGEQRVLAPGIKKYEPPMPDNLRVRVMAGDQEVDLSEVALGWLRSEVSRNQLDYLPEFNQTIGLDLMDVANTQAGANAVINVDAMVAKLMTDGTGGSHVLEPFFALKEQGVTSVTLEMPGSLYRSEMDGADFENLALWDEPLSNQPAVVQAAFKKFGVEAYKPEWVDGEVGQVSLTHDGRTMVIKGSVGDFSVYLDGREKSTFTEIADAKHYAEQYIGAKEKTIKSAYEDLQIMIEEGDARVEDFVIEAVSEASVRKGMDFADVGTGSFKPAELASIMLNNEGVPGHAFLDGVSRNATEQPGYNIVIYADDVARIVDRYARQTGEIGRATDDPAGLTESLRLSFGKSTEALLDAGMVRIVATPADIPGGPHPADVKGATAPDGTVYIVAGNVAEAEARGMMLHEVGVHVGMERMLGSEVFGSVLSELDGAIARGEVWAQAARSAVPVDTPAGLVREEQLAYLVQNSPELPIVQRIIAAVRAWAYRTFDLARDNMTLTEADFRAMAVSALHHAARGEDVPSGLVPAYARGETQDPGKPADELKPFDDAVKRAKSFSSVLRAAADKLDNDAQATAAMRAALPDISQVEVTDLLDQLRRSVKGLRGVARTARSALGSEDVAASLQTEAMKAADELANNLELAAVIERRNASLNMNVRLKATGFLNQFRDSGLDFEGFRGLLVGTERKRAGGRISVDAEQKNFRGEWLGGLVADLEKQDLMRQFTSGDFDRDISVALWNISKKGDNSKLAPEAVQIADVINKYQTDARNTRNRFGAWIRDLQGYISRQSHDMLKIRDAGEKEFKEFVLPRLDVQRSTRDFDGSIDDFLTRVYDDFASGSHMKTIAGEADIAALGRGSSLARRESVSRVLYFKDGNASFEYNQRFGHGGLSASVLQGLDQAGKSTGLLKVLGTNPEATITRLFDEYAESLRGDPVRRAKFLEHRKEMSNLLAQVDGAVNIPGSVTAAKVSSFVRSWQSMAKLGGALISSVTDLANYAAELRFGQDKNLLSGVLDGVSALAQGRASGEKRQILSSLGVFHESTLGSVYARFDSPDLMGGKTAAAMQLFFKLNGLNWWTESLRDGYALTHSHYLATNAPENFTKIPEALRDMLGLYNIDSGKWDILRIATMQEADGRPYMTPEALKTVPRAALENYITSIGRTVSDASVSNLLDDLSSALRTMTIDRMHHAVIEPSARTRAFMLRGTQPGTVPGELFRFISQFKSFPVALIQMTLGREVYGRGYDTIGDYLKRGKGDMVGLATFIALSTAMGYAAMATKDLLLGKNPRPVDDPRTWAAAMVQGGGLGIYGDFLFGKHNRMGGTLTGSLMGPVANVVDAVADLWTRIRTGDDVAATAFNAAVQNTPFMSLFYVRPALNYLVLYKIQEALNPGFLRRMEKRAERDNGQTYYLPPTTVAK